MFSYYSSNVALTRYIFFIICSRELFAYSSLETLIRCFCLNFYLFLLLLLIFLDFIFSPIESAIFVLTALNAYRF